ncbi:phosphoribosyl-ATP diphosphatase [uncultured Faecalicoccus sp.]|uniref:phosphoribosyl-ATP diphosphatase n=1 Tax=uncultured Faecalicoccus sp. TaxID=1971760 RepID=UPI002620A67F|nr:phosphoribosyl-ATP diphosphatase [uncultured Faecalicoccus sp.]
MNEFENLYETIMDRKTHPEPGSYTSYLYEKGLEKILKKVGEETTEVVIAALGQKQKDLVNELGDLFYHLLVLMVQKGVSLKELEEELASRSMKKHNLKAERKPITNL